MRFERGREAEPEVDMWEWLKFFTHSKHYFLLLLPTPVQGTEAKDFPGLGEMERMMDQGKGRMTRIFLFFLFKSNSLLLQLNK